MPPKVATYGNGPQGKNVVQVLRFWGIDDTLKMRMPYGVCKTMRGGRDLDRIEWDEGIIFIKVCGLKILFSLGGDLGGTD